MTDPVALQVGHLSIRWYGIFVALGFLCAYRVAQWRGKRLGFDPQIAGDLTLAAMLGGIIGARTLYVAQNWGSEFSGSPLDALKVWQGGLVFYGGFVGAFLVILAWGLKRRLPLGKLGDLAAPALPVGHAFGRIGCLLNGCCFGRAHEGLLSVTYPGVTRDGFVNGPLQVQRALGVVPAEATTCLPVFPIQVVEALANGLIAAILILLADRPAIRGRLFPLYLGLYALARFAIEFGRGDYVQRPHGLTPAQWFCLVLAPIAVAWLLAWRRAPAAAQGGGPTP